MSYENKISEISAKLNALKRNGGTSKPLAVYGENTSTFSEQSQKFDEIIQTVLQIKDCLNLNAIFGDPSQITTKEDFLLKNLLKQDNIDTINAIFDFYHEFCDKSIAEKSYKTFDNLLQQCFSYECHAKKLVNLSLKTNLPLKKRERLNKFALLSELDSVKALKKLPELVILKNEIEGYINEKKNDLDYKKLLKKFSKPEEFDHEFSLFCSFKISDILQPITIKTSNDITQTTVFGLLESINVDLYTLKNMINDIDVDLKNEFSQLKNMIKALNDTNTKIFKEIKLLRSDSNDNSDATYESLLDELSSLKDDIKTALEFDKD